LGSYSFARYTVQNDHYVGFYQTWTQSILYLLGKQNIRWLSSQQRWTTDTDVPAWRQQPVTNICYAVYRQLSAKMTKQKPTLEVVPPSGDSNDRESAHLAEAILVYLWRLLKFPSKIRRGIGWFLTTGQTYGRVHWDPEAGEMVPLSQMVEVPHPEGGVDAAGAPRTVDKSCPCDDDGEPIMKRGEDGAATTDPDFDAEPALVPQGEIAFDFDDTLSVRWNPEATDPEDAYECFVAKLWPRKMAAEHFNVSEDDIGGGDGDAGDRAMYDDLVSSAASGAGWLGNQQLIGDLIGSSQEQALGDRVLVMEYYHDKDADAGCPEGRHWISIGRKKVWPAENDPDYPTGEAALPYGFWPPVVPILSTPIPGQPQAMSVIGQLVPLNEQLNILDGKIAEHNVMMAMGGKWIVHPDDKGLTIDSDPGQVIASRGYVSGHPPIQAEMKTLDAAIYQEREVILNKIRLVVAMSEAAFGTKPEGVSAGRAFLVLSEETDSVIGPDLQAFENGYEEIGRRMLVVAQRHYTEKRSIAIRGERGRWEIRQFMNTDLVDGLGVRVQAGSSFPWSKTAQLDTKMSILSQFPGLVTKPDGSVDQERFAEFLETSGSGLQSFETDEDPDLVEIEREHAMFEAYNGTSDQTLPQIAFWQAHPKHLDGHFRFMKRDYARFLRWSMPAQMAFIAHMQETVQAVDEIAGQIAAASQPPQPGMAPAQPPGPGSEGGASETANVPAGGAGGAGGSGPPQLSLMQGGAQTPPAQAGGPTGLTAPNTQPALGGADLASAQQ
jgi:hypothetical protein